MGWGDRWATNRRNIAELGTPLSAEDAARLHMGTATNPMVITVALLLDRPITLDALSALLEARLAGHPRFRSRVLEPALGLGLPRWVPDLTFDVSHHLRCTVLRDPSAGALPRFVGELTGTPFDAGRALWTMDLVQGLREGSALVLRVNHALADGLGLMWVLLDLCDEGLHQGAVPLAPSAGLSLRARAERVVAGARSAIELARREAEPATPLRRPVGARKVALLSRELAVAQVSRAAHALGVTVTALVVSALGGALHACLGGACPPGLTLHLMLPVSARGSEGPAGARPRADAGNAYSSVFLPMPIAPREARSRARAVHDELRRLRATGAASGGLLAGAAGAAGATVERVGVAFFSRRASAVFSSIRGPESLLHVGGATVRDVVAWAPSVGSVGLAFTMVSYGGRLRVAALADAGVAGIAERLVAALGEQLVALL